MYSSGMIVFSRVGTQLCVSLAVIQGMPLPLLYWECHTELLAELLVRQLQSKLGDKIAEARAVAYLDGFRDAKAKRRKQTEYFCRRFEE